MLAPAVRGADPRAFAMVMATGIVSVALRQAGSPGLSAALLWIASAGFVLLVVASVWRAAAFPADVRGDLARPDRVFSLFAVPAAASVLAARITDRGQHVVVAALTAFTALAWVAACCVVVVFLAGPGRPRPRRALTDVNGSWELWVVGTQSVAIAATSAYTAGVVPDRLAAWAGLILWSAGAVLYVVVTALVIIRLVTAGLAPGDPFAPYWVTMGAASITILAAAQILHITGPAVLSAARPAVTDIALAFWAVATGLIPVLAVIGAARRLRGHAPRGFRRELWMIVFPVGMYATASMRIGSEAGLPPVRELGTAAVWVAAAVWAAVFAGMLAWPIARRIRRYGPDPPLCP
ncbi:MAG TPA: tellurite resistance/C4-dicarboxylate transporter family protein [Streptosporangiaceae bacterium]